MKTFTIGSVLLKSLFSKPSTRMYPTVSRECPERTRGHVDIVAKDCIGCGICMKKCPSGAITVDKQNGTWTIDRMSCIQCEYCVNSCPKTCLIMMTDYTPPNIEKTVDSFQIPKKEVAKE